MKSNWQGFQNSAGYGTQCLTCHKVWSYPNPSTCVCSDAPPSLAEAYEELARKHAEAQGYADRLLRSIWPEDKFPAFQPLSDMLGMLTQLDHAFGSAQHLQMQMQAELKAALAVAKQLAEDRAEAFRIMTESEFRCHQPSDDGGDDCANAENCFYHSMLALTEPKGAYQSLVKQRS